VEFQLSSQSDFKRMSVASTRVQEVRQVIDMAKEDYVPMIDDPHLCCSLIKLLFNSLPKPLIPNSI
jgi:type III secretion system FlhB-like substrate exporter